MSSDMGGGATGATLPEGWPANLQPQDYKGDDAGLRGKKIIMYNGSAHTYSVNDTGQVVLTPAVPPPDGSAAQVFTFATVNGQWLDPQSNFPLLAVANPSDTISQWAITDALADFDDIMRKIHDNNKEMYQLTAKLFVQTLLAKFEEAKASGDLERQQAALAIMGAYISMGTELAAVGAFAGSAYGSRKAAGKSAEKEQAMKDLNRAGDDQDAREAILAEHSIPGEDPITAGALAREAGKAKADAKSWSQMSTVFPHFMQALSQNIPTILFKKEEADMKAAQKMADVSHQALDQLAQREAEMLREISQTIESHLRAREEENRAITEGGRMGMA